MQAWKRTTTGRYIDLNLMRPSDVDLEDVISSLSRMVRFDGHGEREPLSVLQHSLLVLDLLIDEGNFTQLLGLVHDAHEAYIGDIGTPVKTHFGFDGDTNICSVVRHALLPPNSGYVYGPVKDADILSLDIERRSLWNSNGPEHDQYWPLPKGPRLNTSQCLEHYKRAKSYDKSDFRIAYRGLYEELMDGRTEIQS